MQTRELHHVEALLKLEPTGPAARRRMELRYIRYLAKADPVQADADKEGDWLLREIDNLQFGDLGMVVLENETLVKGVLKEDRMRAAIIHGRRGDLHSRAKVLHEITKLDATDIEGLFLYSLSLRDLEDQTRDQATLNTTLRGAVRRMENLKKSGVLDEEEVKTWRERFQSLRQ